MMFSWRTLYLRGIEYPRSMRFPINQLPSACKEQRAQSPQDRYPSSSMEQNLAPSEATERLSGGRPGANKCPHRRMASCREDRRLRLPDNSLTLRSLIPLLADLWCGLLLPRGSADRQSLEAIQASSFTTLVMPVDESRSQPQWLFERIMREVSRR